MNKEQTLIVQIERQELGQGAILETTIDRVFGGDHLEILLLLDMADGVKSIEMTSMENSTPGFKVYFMNVLVMQYGWPEEKYDKWMKDLEKRKEKHPFEERRIGWISEIPGYRTCFMGQSVKDFCK